MGATRPTTSPAKRSVGATRPQTPRHRAGASVSFACTCVIHLCFVESPISSTDDNDRRERRLRRLGNRAYCNSPLRGNLLNPEFRWWDVLTEFDPACDILRFWRTFLNPFDSCIV